ncbi:MAG: protein kinase [Gemmatimonadetes bacterium]|nr:protein kinase [Gemmatimonadota bacterium]
MSEVLGRLSSALSERYRIERELGRGGMATVYLAHDLRHDRPVAIKLFLPELSAVIGAERFLNEIKVTAHLQHPHILALYDSGSADGLLYYVMPYVEGESLRQRLDRERQLPIAEAVRIAREAADALDYAHRHGVIHRDVKPENILLHEGRVLVGDFGIALALRNAGGERITQTGISLGTPQYMSPEQATADRDIDARSDIYSLSCVLYEMLAGEPPHTGPTAQAVIAKIVTDKPRPIAELRETVPPGVAATIHTGLARLPADRFDSAGGFASALTHSGMAQASGASGLAVGDTRIRHARTVRLLGVAGIALIALAGAWLLGRRSSPAGAAPPPSQLSILAPTLGAQAAGLQRQVALTPDGSAVIYVGSEGTSGARLLLQRLEEPEPTRIPGSDGLLAPEVSPDGRWLAAQSFTGDIVRFPFQGTSAQPAPLARGGFFAWHPDGSLWFSLGRTLQRVLPGQDSIEVRIPALERVLWVQQVLDDGNTALVLEAGRGGATGAPCLVLDLTTGHVTPLIDEPVVAVRYTAGYLVFARPDGTLVAALFDRRRTRMSGEAVAIAAGVSLTGNVSAQLAVARNGTVAYIPEDPRSLVLVDRTGATRPATEQRHNFHSPRFSPDGRRLAVDFVSAEGRDVWVRDLDQGTLTRATFDRDGHDPTWAPDGTYITYVSSRSGALGIYRVRPGSGAPPESLFASSQLNYTGVWVPDGKAIVTVVGLQSQEDVAILRNDGRGPIEPVIATEFREAYPAISPNGRWLAFVSDQSGRLQVYVRPLQGDVEQVQVSLAGGDEPVWGRDGGELFYRATGEGRVELVAAAVQTAPTFRVMSRKALFSLADYVPTTPHASYDVSPDGKTFVMVRRNPASRIVVIQNLPELVRRRSGEAARR